MKLAYTVSQDKDSRLWYAHMVRYSYIPVMSERGTFHRTKKGALQVAADSMGLPLKKYMQLRQKGGKG